MLDNAVERVNISLPRRVLRRRTPVPEWLVKPAQT